MSKYKCGDHTLELACPGCIRAWIKRHDKMLAFIRDIANLKEPEEKLLAMAEAGYHVDHVLNVRSVLREIGEL